MHFVRLEGSFKVNVGLGLISRGEGDQMIEKIVKKVRPSSPPLRVVPEAKSSPRGCFALHTRSATSGDLSTADAGVQRCTC